MDVRRKNTLLLPMLRLSEDIWQLYTFIYAHISALNTFKGPYHKWAELNDFNSMLPEDKKAHCAQVLEDNLWQMNVNDHFKPALKEAQPELYSDEFFKQASVEWLIETNQVM